MKQLGQKPLVPPEDLTSSDFLLNFYDSECTLLYFLVESYLLNEKGTDLVSADQEKILLATIDESLHHFKEGDRSVRSKNAYDVLFKATGKRVILTQEILKKQSKLAHLLLTRIVQVFKAYTALLAEGRGEGSDLEAESKFLLKKMAQLESGPGIFESEMEWIAENVGSSPKKGSLIWGSSRALIILVTPLLLGLLRSTSEDMRQLIADCL